MPTFHERKEHTSAPWFLHDGKICHTLRTDDNFQGAPTPVDMSNEVNANLVVASPNMLRTLEKVKFFVEEVSWLHDDGASLLKQIKNVIAKATGQS